MLQGGGFFFMSMSAQNNVFPLKCYFLQMVDSPGDVLRICQHRPGTLMEICPELVKDKVVQKKVEIRSSDTDGAISATGHTPRATCNSPALAP